MFCVVFSLFRTYLKRNTQFRIRYGSGQKQGVLVFTGRNLVVSNDFLSVSKLLRYVTGKTARLSNGRSFTFLTKKREKMSQRDICESLRNSSIRLLRNSTECLYRTTFSILMLIYVRKIPDPYNLSVV